VFFYIDGSADEINSQLISAIKDERIKYFKQKGYVNCLNLGIEKSLGEYIARMDSDDISYPTRLEEQVKFLDNNPEVSLCSCLIERFGYYEGYKKSRHKKDIDLISTIACSEFIHTAMMFRKDINLEYEHLKPMEDCLLFRKLLLKGYKFAIIDKFLLKSYVSNCSLMRKYPKYIEHFMSRINIFALSKHYNFELSFIDEIFTKKSYTINEIDEYLNFVHFLMKKSSEHKLDVLRICKPFFAYMISKCKTKISIIFKSSFYQSFFAMQTTLFAKNFLEFIFSISNEYHIKNDARVKHKVLCILGIKFKFKKETT